MIIYSRLSAFFLSAFLLPFLNGATTPNWTGTINAVPDAYGIHRTGGCEGCDAGGISAQEIAPAKGGSIQFTASPGPYRLLGLTTVKDLSFSGMAYAIGIGTSDLAEISEGGSYRASIPFTSGDLFQISVEGGKVSYLKNGEIVYTSTSVPSAALHVEALLLDLSSRIDNPRLSPRRLTTSSPLALAVESKEFAGTKSTPSDPITDFNSQMAAAIAPVPVSTPTKQAPTPKAKAPANTLVDFSAEMATAIASSGSRGSFKVPSASAVKPVAPSKTPVAVLHSQAPLVVVVKPPQMIDDAMTIDAPIISSKKRDVLADGQTGRQYLELTGNNPVDPQVLQSPVAVVVRPTAASPSPVAAPQPSKKEQIASRHPHGDAVPTEITTPAPVPVPATPSPTAPPARSSAPSGGVATGESALSAVWANNGEDKITQDETRATKSSSSVLNNSWDGQRVTVFGAQNEMVAFNLVLEAATKSASKVSVQFQTLTGPGNATISSTTPSQSTIFNWTQRNIELFFVRYLQIKGLSYFGYPSGWQGIDERSVPKRFERPWTGAGLGTGLWTDRPDHDKFYPDIAVPLELAQGFNIAQGTNQSIWVDIYIPKTAAPGTYNGTLTVSENGTATQKIPVQLTVRGFALPDDPTVKTMLYYTQANVTRRMTGSTWVQPGTAPSNKSQQAIEEMFQLAHRHKISLIGDDDSANARTDYPSAPWVDRLNGNLFTAANGYAGPGTGTGNNIYSILSYGGFQQLWLTGSEGSVSEADVWLHANNWEQWFEDNAPTTDHFLYLCDECMGNGKPAPAQVNTWASWMKANPGEGKNLRSMATVSFDTAQNQEPALDYVTDTDPGNSTVWANAVASIRSRPGGKIFMYNPRRPYAGSFTIEDDGVALRELPWAQYKMGVDRFFYWESTYYNDFQNSGQADTNVFERAATFGGTNDTQDPVLGEWGYGHTNGEGVLFYPGTDVIYPQQSYNVTGMFASLRLKHWRRGIQDTDYLALANAINPAATNKVIEQMVPKALWELNDLGGYIVSPLPYSINPDDWEKARLQLAHIIDGQ